MPLSHPSQLSLGLAAAVALAAWIVPTAGDPPADPAHTPPGPTSPAELPSPASAPPAPTDHPAAEPDGLDLRASLDHGALLRGGDGTAYLVVEINGEEQAAGPRQPVHLGLVIDTSGSMAAAGKIEAAQAAARQLVDALQPGDGFSLCTFDDQAQVAFPQSIGWSPQALGGLIDRLQAGGGTNLAGGLEAGLAEVDRTRTAGVRRVMVLSDGLANVGPRDTNTLAAIARQGRSRDVSVSAAGLGLDFDERLLTAISDAGGGRYTYANNSDDLQLLFAAELAQAGRVSARQVEVALHLAPGVELIAVYGYEQDDGSRTADGHTAWLGDVHSGERRKVVARLRLPEGAEAVGSVAVRGAAGPGWSQPITARWTTDPQANRASADRNAVDAAGLALVGAALDESLQRWTARDAEGARAAVAAARAAVAAMAGPTSTAPLAQALRSLDDSAQRLARTLPESDEGVALRMDRQLQALGYLE